MATDTFIHIRSTKFPVVDGEDEMLFNPGTYGLALCRHLETTLRERGHAVPSFNPEDWGWWLQVTKEPVRLAVQIYAREQPDGSLDHAVLLNETGGSTFALRKSKRIDRTPHVERLRTDLVEIFETDPDVEFVRVTDEFPLD